ncbi:probable LRR receptor-like serine/threonine-protein kinase At1g14390 [Impatiens glandulifera]|uniref:probable LRR receptor-like serine/threonine-protein kinase At1g14390 n=1 Tax=Impatiens glandulifera TaxID=253017 RepID=UPI001FB059BB|nr:probable LRR receptor-like serine/threonine-protein kinase At1g14390 [Impatiens glandulifera]
MEALWISLMFISLSFFFPTSKSQLSSSETKTLFKIQHILQYPKPLSTWSNSTNFCNLNPTQSLTIICTNTHVTEFTLSVPVSDSKPLSTQFSIDSLFTVITKLPNLKLLKLVGLRLWGTLPAKISRLKSLELLDLSSNLIDGVLPESIGSMITLKILVLNDNLFNGNIPNLNHLQVLEVINLGNNRFGPIFPLLPFNLVNITLSNNSMRSSIPEEIKNFNLLRLFDLSSNKLLGPLPSSIFSIPSIRYLNVANNQLTGALPSNMSCNSNLSYVDISKNLFIGKLPVCLSNSSNNIVISSWNCLRTNSSKDQQHPISYCNKQALAVDPPVIRRREAKSTIKLGLILGIIGGVVGTAVVIMASILLVLRVSERKKTDVFSNEKSVMEKTNVPSATRLLTSLLPPYHVFTNEEMEDATNNFDESNLVGEGLGSAGQIYKGWLRDGSSVLVRCLKIKHKQFSVQNMQQEMGMVSKLRHRHLVSVLGHCIDHHHNSSPNTSTTSIFIVLEQMTNGFLKDHLSDWRKRDNLKWPQRMGIAIGIGRGVQFLHSGIAPGIFGNDLRIENVVLDDTLTAKLSSYNIPLSSLSSKSGSGSESPLNMLSTLTLPSRSENGEKDDIYQLGAILLQMISGKVVGSETELNSLKTEMEDSLVESPSRLKEVIDPSIRGSFAFDSLKTAVEISIKCLCEDPNGRPCIDDFLWHMQYSVQVQEGWTSSGNLSTKM